MISKSTILCPSLWWYFEKSFFKIFKDRASFDRFFKMKTRIFGSYWNLYLGFNPALSCLVISKFSSNFQIRFLTLFPMFLIAMSIIIPFSLLLTWCFEY